MWYLSETIVVDIWYLEWWSTCFVWEFEINTCKRLVINSTKSKRKKPGIPVGLRPPRGLDCLRHCAYKFPFKKNIRNKMLSMKNILPCCPRGIRKFAIPELSDFRKGITCSNNQKITDLFWKKIVGFSPKLCLYFMIVWPFFILHFSVCVNCEISVLFEFGSLCCLYSLVYITQSHPHFMIFRFRHP